jgi:DNA-binding NarL/FixJ family response regulator
MLGVKVVALSIYSDCHFAVDMLKADVSGYVLKTCLSDDFIRAIRTVMTADEIYLSPRIAGIVVDDYISAVPAEEVSIFLQQQFFHIFLPPDK